MFADQQPRRLAFTRVLAVSTIGCLAFSWNLWASRPHYPRVPLLEFVPAPGVPFDEALRGLLVGLLVGVVVWPRSRGLIALVLAAFGLLFLQDQSRLWPSFYQFGLLFLLLLSRRREDGPAGDERVLAGARFVLAMTYFWGGVHKLNPHFFYEEFPGFVEPITARLPFETLPLPSLAATAATLEALLGLGLLTRRLRGVALAGAMLMHLLILFCIGPLRDHWNNSSWMWGMGVAALTGTLFFRAPAFRFSTLFAAPRWRNAPQGLALLLVGGLVGVLPALNGVNRWDSALSFNVYSGNVDDAEIHLLPTTVHLLPEEIAELVHLRFGRAVLIPNEWSRREFNANAYPETRVFQAVFRRVGSYLPAGSAELYVREKSGWFFPRRIDRYVLNRQGDPVLAEAGVPPPGG